MATSTSPVGTHRDQRSEIPVVGWFDPVAGVGVLTLPGGDQCLVQRCDADDGGTNAWCATQQHRWSAGEPGHSPPGHAHHALAASPKAGDWWRALRPSFADAERAGTWGDGGRDL